MERVSKDKSKFKEKRAQAIGFQGQTRKPLNKP